MLLRTSLAEDVTYLPSRSLGSDLRIPRTNPTDPPLIRSSANQDWGRRVLFNTLTPLIPSSHPLITRARS